MIKQQPWEKTDISQIDITPGEYEEARKSGIMSAHLLSLFARSPRMAQWAMKGLLPQTNKVAYTIGRATHCYLLEGPEVFASRYSVFEAPINPKTGSPYGKDSDKFAAAYDKAGADGREPIDSDTYELCVSMADSMAEHPANDLFAKGNPEVAIRGTPSGFKTLCQSRLDWLHIANGQALIVDLKTCKDIDSFKYDARKYHYDWQLAFYRMMVRSAHKVSKVVVKIVAIEKTAPFRIGIYYMSEATLDIAEAQIKENLYLFEACVDMFGNDADLSLIHI